MLRSSLIAAGAAVLCSSSFAQRTLDASKVYPITSPIQNAGVFNVNTQRWMSPSRLQAQQGVVQSIFDNTCSWTGGAYYTGTGSCETYIDEGIVPGPGNLDFAAIGGTGAVATNNVVLIQFGYCTNFAVPLLTIGFYDTLGGQCGGFATNGIAPTGGGQPTLQQQAAVAGVAPGGINPSGKAYYDFGAAPGSIPGDTTPGGTGVSCWITGVFLGNTGFCLQSDADGTWDNDPDLDRFNWSFEMDNVFTANPPDGVILAGEPLAAPGYGACSYNIACAADPLTGAACGTGFGQDDGFWINVDKDSATTPNTGVACFSAPTAGTGCYWFGGHPAGIFGGFWMVMVADGECGTTVPSVSNCQTAPTTNQSCNSVVSTVGLPSASSNSTFTVTFGSLNQGTTGVVFYGTNGPIANTWSNHSLICVKSPTVRLGGVPGASGNTGGVGACNGQYSFNANAVIQNAAIAAGTRVDMQAWVRDSSNPKTTYQTDAVNFVVGP